MNALALLVSTVAALAQVPDGRSIIRGQLVGFTGEPIVAAEVKVHTEARFPDGSEAPVLRDRAGSRFSGFLGATDREGRFHMSIPTPGNDEVTVRLTPDDFHSMVIVEFGLSRRSAPLLPGDNDLGTLVCKDAGVVFGHVLTEQGLPIEGAQVRPEPGATGTAFFPSVLSDADGAFRLGHLPTCTFALLIKAKGFSSRRDLLVTLRGGEVLEPMVIEMQRAPRLSGLVTDEGGAPIDGASVSASPRFNGYSANTRTGPDGRFTLQLDRQGGYKLEVIASGFEVHRARCEASSSDIAVALSAAPMLSIEVCDADNGLPIRDFGVRLMCDDDAQYYHQQPIAIERHQDGTVHLARRLDHDSWQVGAPGYAPRESRLSEQAGDDLVISLSRASRVRGKILSDGNPVKNAVVQLALDVTSREPEYTPTADWTWIHQDESDLTRFLGRMRQHITGADGRFEFDDLASGTYRVSCLALDERFVDVRQVHLPTGGSVDLGELSLSQGGRVHGRITRDGKPAAHEDVSLGQAYLGTVTDSTGAYEFLRVRPGRYMLFSYVPLRVGRDEAVRVDVDLGAEGEGEDF